MQIKFTIPVTFGDCDPAGIVFYPNIFRWMDAGFHQLLRPHGGHAAICKHLGAIGVGLMEASAEFKSPIHDGDALHLTVSVTQWSRRSMTVIHAGRVRDRPAFKGREVRGLFMPVEHGIVAADLKTFRSVLEGSDVD